MLAPLAGMSANRLGLASVRKYSINRSESARVMVYPDHDAGGFAAIDAVLSHRRKPEAIRAHASQWGKHLDVEDFLRARARGSGGSWRRNGPLKSETRVRIPLGPPT